MRAADRAPKRRWPMRTMRAHRPLQCGPRRRTSIDERSSRRALLGARNVRVAIADQIEDDVCMRQAAPIALCAVQLVLTKVDPPRIQRIFSNDITAADEGRRPAEVCRQQRTCT